MATIDPEGPEMDIRHGGEIPGSGLPAFTLQLAKRSLVPILIAVPHAGRSYCGSTLRQMRNPEVAALRLEDRLVDLIGQDLAKATGAALLVASAPRAMIDLNRAVDDVDWDMIRPPASRVSEWPRHRLPGKRARSGLGLIPRRIPGFGELWRHQHEESELVARVQGIHEPYHIALADALGALRDRWGSALLIDLHSMPPLGLLDGHPAAEFVLGDRFGSSCHGQIIASAFGYFGKAQRLAAHNRPYSGGYVIERHASPESGLHAIQLEIDRASYLDSRLAEPGAGYGEMVQLLIGLVRQLAGEVAMLASPDSALSWAEAAE